MNWHAVDLTEGAAERARQSEALDSLRKRCQELDEKCAKACDEAHEKGIMKLCVLVAGKNFLQ